MFTIVVVVVGSLAILVLLLFLIVIIGIRQETSTEELSGEAPSLVAAFARRSLGVYVRRPHSPLNGKLRRITEQHLAEFITSREDVADAS